jgi:hypothetical protein
MTKKSDLLKTLASKEAFEKAVKEANQNKRKHSPKKNQIDNSLSVKLKRFYVYVLIDPRDEQVFYVGKGQEDRLFQHEKEAERTTTEGTEKHKKISGIQNSGQQVKRLVIGRFDTEQEAFSIEGVLIHWVYGIKNLTNIQSGHGVNNIRPKGHHEGLAGIDEPELGYCERTQKNREKNDIVPFLEEIRELIEKECSMKFDEIHTNNDRHTYLVKFIKGVRLTVVSHHTARRAAAITIESLDGKKHHKERVKDICGQTKIECKDNGRYGRIMPAGSYTDPCDVLEKFQETLSELNKVF